MAIHKITFKDGSTAEVEAPEDASMDQLAGLVNAQRNPEYDAMLQGRAERSERNQAELDALRESQLPTDDGRTAFGRGLSRGVDVSQQNLGSAVEGIGSTLGLGGLERYGAGVVSRNEEELQAAERYATRMDDVEGVGTGLSYTGEIAGESAAPMAGALAGGAAGAAIGAGFGGVGAIPGALIGSVVGAAGAMMPLFYGGNRERQKEAIDRGIRTEISEGAAFLTAIPQSAADAILTAIGAKFFLKPAAQAGGGLLTRVGRGAAAGAAVEVPTEIGQAVLERAQAGLPIADEEAIREYAEAGVAAGLLGGGLGGAAGAARRSAAPGEAPPPGSAAPQGELDLLGGMGERPTPDRPAPEQAEMFSDEDLGQAPAGADPRQGDLFSAPQETLARRAKELEREKATMMNRPMGEAAAEFEATDNRFFEQNKRKTDAARAGIASLDAGNRRPAATTRDMRDMVSESQDQVADEKARDRAGLSAAGRGDVATFEQPDLFARELEQEQRRLGPAELRNPEQYMDTLLTEKEEAPAFNTPAAQGDLVDMIGEQEAQSANATVRAGRAAAQEVDIADRTQAQTQLKAESAEETAQGKLTSDQLAQTNTTRTKILQDTVANTGEVRRPEALRNLYETALTEAGIADAKATPQEMESLRRASDAIRAKAPAAEPAVAPAAEVKDPRQLAMEARVAGKPPRPEGPQGAALTPLNADALTMDSIPAPLDIPVAKAPTIGATNVETPVTAGDRTSDAGGTGVSGPRVQDTTDPVGTAKEPAGAVRGGLDRDLGGVGRAAEGKKSERDTLTDAGARNATPGREDPAGAKRGTLPKPVKVEQTATPAEKAKFATQEATDADKASTARVKSKDADAKQAAAFAAQSDNVQAVGKDNTDTSPDAVSTPLTAGDKGKILALMDANRTKAADSQLANAVQKYFGQFPTFNAAFDDIIYQVGQDMPDQTRQSKAFENDPAGAEFFYANPAKNLPSIGKTSARKITDWIASDASGLSPELKADVKARLQAESASRIDLAQYLAGDRVSEATNRLSPDEIDARNALAGKDVLPLPAELVIDIPVRPAVRKALIAGDLKGALEALQFTAGSKDVSLLAQKLSENVGNTKLVTKKNLKANDGTPVAGYFDPATNTIFLDAETGITTHAVLHEMLHATTSSTIANKAHPLTKKLAKIFDGVKEQLAGEYGVTSLDEFVAEAQSNPDFQTQLKTTAVNGRNPWQQMVRAVANYVRTLMGRPTVAEDSTFTAVDKLVQEIIGATYDGRAATKIYMQIKTPAEAAKALNDFAANVVRINSGKSLYDYVDSAKTFMAGNTPTAVKKAYVQILPANILGSIAKADISIAPELNEIVNRMSAEQRARNEGLVPLVAELRKFKQGSAEKFAALQNLVPNASAERIDPREADFSKAYSRSKKSEGYNEADARVAHKAFRKQYESLGADGQALYKKVTNNFEKGLKDIMGAIETNLQATIPDGATRKRAMDDLAKLLNMEAGVIRPYAPLTRQGDYRLFYTTIDPKTGNIESYSEYFTSVRQREAAKKNLLEYNAEKIAGLRAGDPKIALMNTAWEEGTRSTVPNYANAPKGTFIADVLKTLKDADVDNATMDRIVALALDSMPERSFMQSFRTRADTRGFLGDITPTGMAGVAYNLVDTVEKKGRDINRQVVQMVYGAELAKFRADLKVAAPTATTNPTVSVYRDALDQIASFAANPNTPGWSQKLTSAAYAMTMGVNLSSAALTTFDVFMSTAPRLAGRYGDKEAARALGSATKVLFGSPKEKTVETMGVDGKMEVVTISTGKAGFDVANYDFNDPNLDPKLRALSELADVATQAGQLNQTINQEQLDMGSAENAWEKFNMVAGFLFHHSERYNRQVALVATYTLEMDRMKARKGGTLTSAERTEAAKYAVNETEFTMGSTSSGGRPIASQGGIGNVAMLFKRFAISKYHMMAQMLGESVQAGTDTDTKENRRIAQKQLGRFFITTGVFSGVAGMPLMGALGQIYDLFTDDDEDSFDAMMRKNTGELFWKGAVNELLGVDVASRIGMNSLLYRPPIYDKDQSLLWTLAEEMGGPVVGLTTQTLRGMGEVFDGEILQGVKTMSPSALKNVFKSVEQASSGEVTTRRGDAVTEDIGISQILLQFGGFANADVKRTYEINKNERDKQAYLSGERVKLLRASNIARSNGDRAGVRDAQEAIREYNKNLPRGEYKKLISPDTQRKSQTAFATRSSNMVGGMEYTPSMRQSLREYDQGIQMFDFD